jgi:hypothetical protein
MHFGRHIIYLDRQENLQSRPNESSTRQEKATPTVIFMIKAFKLYPVDRSMLKA